MPQPTKTVTFRYLQSTYIPNGHKGPRTDITGRSAKFVAREIETQLEGCADGEWRFDFIEVTKPVPVEGGS